MTQSQQNSADAVTKYRGAMAGFLKSSLAFMGHTAGPQTGHPGLDADTKAELDRDSFHVFRLHAILLVRKARLHVIAVLIANRNSNLHSLAVQMRPALECVGQVVSVFHNLFIASDPDLVHQYLNADYLQTMQRQTKGHFGRDYLLESIAKADPLGWLSPYSWIISRTRCSSWSPTPRSPRPRTWTRTPSLRRCSHAWPRSGPQPGGTASH